MLPRKSDLIKIIILITVLILLLFSWTHNSDFTKNAISINSELRPARKLTFLSLETPSNNNSFQTLSSSHEFTLIMDLFSNSHNFTYILNNEYLCKQCKFGVFLFIYVHSAPDHFKRRIAIRETWGSKQLYNELRIVVAFLIGRSNDNSIQASVEYESTHYGDIIQEDFQDSYKNLTRKALSALKWIIYFCPQAEIILKVDDDIFVNIFNLVMHLHILMKHKLILEKMILCHLWTQMPVIREKKSKWYVSKEEYFEDYYPPYCSGAAYILSKNVVPALYNASLMTPLFWVDDSFITGILAKKVNASIYSLNSAYLFNTEEMEEKILHSYSIFAHVPGNLDKHYLMWKKLVEKVTLKRSEKFA